MDSGGWIALMMIAGTGIVCLLAVTKRSALPLSGSNGWRLQLEAAQLELAEGRRRADKLRAEFNALSVEVEQLRSENARLRGARDYWVQRYIQATKP